LVDRSVREFHPSEEDTYFDIPLECAFEGSKSSSAEVRLNDGGRADAVALLVSYFVEGNPQELVGIYWKSLSKAVESFTSPSIKGGNI